MISGPIFKFTKIRKVSLNALLKGDYKTTATDSPNTFKTETYFGKRIQFFAQTFEPFHKYLVDDDFIWILNHNRELIYFIL